MTTVIRSAGHILADYLDELQDVYAGRLPAQRSIRYVDRMYRCARCARWVLWRREGERFHPLNADGTRHLCRERRSAWASSVHTVTRR